MTEKKDILVGAEAIAKSVGLKTRQIYSLHQRRKAPIKNTPGLGLTASKSALEAYLSGQPTKEK